MSNIKKLCLVTLLAFFLLPKAAQAFVPQFDHHNRLIARDGFNHGTHETHEIFTYDAVGNLLTAVNENSQLSFTYDAMDRLATASTKLTTAHLPPTTYQSGYAYDAGGLVTNLSYATGKSVSYTHDQDGLLTSVKDWNNNEWILTRDAMGKLTGISSPDGNNSTYTYDAANRLTSWSVGTIAGRTITYDTAGRRIQDDITAGAIPKPTLQRTAKNTFDAADKLISASVRYGQGTNSTPHITETFAYDGNRAMANILTRSHEGHEESLCYLSYNSQNQLASLQTDHLPLTTDHFQYDALGNRIKTGDTLWIPNHSDPLKRPLIEINADTGAILRYYLWGDNRLLGFIDSSGTLTVVHSDERGNVIALTDTNGSVLYTANYGPHGEDWGSTGINPTLFTWLGGYGVQTINSDTPLRLYLTRHRVYSATLNRFLSTDPLGISGGLNLYTYGEGNPLAYIDPLGLLSWRQVGYFAGGVAVGTVTATAVVVAAPVAVTGLVAAGLSTTAASATVTVGLTTLSAAGVASTGITTYNAVKNNDWDTVAFNAGTIVGGLGVGIAGGGRSLAGLSGTPSTTPGGLLGDVGLGYNPSYPGGSIAGWLGSGPTPQSGGAIATLTGTGISTAPEFFMGLSSSPRQNAYK